jgi:hypothetical protein
VPSTRLVLAALCLFFVAGCSGDDPTVQSSPTPSVRSSSSPAPSPSATLPTGVDRVVSVSYADGKVTGPDGRVKLKRGTTVQLVVSSDKADEVHLHGYDKSVDVPAGGTVRLTFRATIPGIFEVELEERHVVLVRLQVQ